LDLTGDEVAVADVVFPQRSLNHFYKYVATGHTLEARSISREILAQAEALMWEKNESPLSAVVAAYVLLRMNDSDPQQRDRMDQWTARLQQQAQWLPDATAIRIEFLARTGRDEDAIALLLSIGRFGCPWFRSGLSYLVERLRMYVGMNASRVRTRKALSSDDARYLAKLLKVLSALALKTDSRQTLCVYRDIHPDLDRVATTLAESLALVGDTPMATPEVRMFRGLVEVRDGRATLSSGGLAAELRRSDGVSAVDLIDSIKGTIASISGVQRGDIIEVNDNFASDVAETTDIGDMRDVLVTLEAQYARLKDVPGVLAVRPGYRRQAGVQSVEPSIVVIVDRKCNASELTSRETLPSRLGTVRVDVVEPSPQERFTGRYVDFDDWRRALGLIPRPVDDSATIGYRPPPAVRLQPVTVRQVVCHVGPDAGWKVLEGFLDATQQQLDVSMYDFTAPHVVERLSALAAKTEVRLNMILQVDKAQERQSLLALHERWGERFGFAPAVVSGAERLFKNSYHTKVAVRDSNCLWLSSGNWTSTSQPMISPGPQPFLYRLGNREWHVVVEDTALAKMFEGFVLWDREEAKRVGISSPAEPPAPDVLVSDTDFLDADAMVAQPGPFEPAVLPFAGGPVRVQPLMTPDNYPEAILNLIESAVATLYLQFSYIRLPVGVDGYHRLLQAVNRKMREGVDVRVIVDRRNQRDADLQFLRSLGWDMERVRLQRSSVHNKGIIVDGKITVVGSHNWSSDGVQWNRDASLVFHHREIAEYFARVFLFDWNQLTLPVSAGAVHADIAELGQPTPPGTVRLPWHTWFGT
jgi:phosphatidylserine/phosphatidylglycerophosphate/cardiolipin synthase-like enzyme